MRLFRQTESHFALATAFTTSIAIQVLNIASGILLARAFPPAERGVLAAVILWPTLLAAVGNLGLPDAVTFRVSTMRPRLSHTVSTSLSMAVLQSFLMVLLGFVLIRSLSERGHVEDSKAAFTFLFYIPLNMLALVAAAVFNGLQQYRAFNIARISVITLNVLFLAPLYYTDNLTIINATYAYLLSNFLTCGIALILLFQTNAERIKPSMCEAQELVRYGLKSHVGNISGVLNDRLDQLLISVFMNPVQLGYYVIALTTSSGLSIIGTSLNVVVFPKVSAAAAAQKVSLAKQYLTLTVVTTGIAATAMLILTPSLITLFFGTAYQQAVPVARVLVVGIAVMCLSRVMGAILKGYGEPLAVGIAELFGLGVTILGLSILLPRYGLMGAAVTSTAAYMATLIWVGVKLTRRWRVVRSDYGSMTTPASN